MTRVDGYSSPILGLRKQLDLYANLRPIHSMPVPGSRPGIDMLIVRENTECLYVRQERMEDDGNTAIAQRVITRRASERIARKAFDLARARHNLTQRRQAAKSQQEPAAPAQLHNSQFTIHNSQLTINPFLAARFIRGVAPDIIAHFAAIPTADQIDSHFVANQGGAGHWVRQCGDRTP